MWGKKQMIFLKRIEAHGFKSFADQISLNFEYGMTGIVGPNGSGKSNINDAIRWTLGEQSLKSLRGDSMEDVVFSGSEGKSAHNMAEVTLVFDNSNHVFSSLENVTEVAIKRRYDKINNESEYFLNGEKVRQKDVQEIALETGLTKSSLAIISQGSVNNFVEAKPDERRQLFDEAAGVAKYKKRKEESIRKLIRSNENLDRVNDIINELDRRLPSLGKQATKAKKYQEKEALLRKHEVAFLVSDLKIFNARSEELKERRHNLKADIDALDQKIKKDAMDRDSISKESLEFDRKISQLNSKYTSIVEKISKLEVKKVSFEAKQNEIKMNESEYRAEEIKRATKEIEIKIQSEEEHLDHLLVEETKINEGLQYNSTCRSNCNYKLDAIRKSMNKTELKIEQLQERKESSEALFEGVRNVLDNKTVLPGIIGTVQELISVEDQYLNAIGALMQQGVLQNIVINNAGSAKVAIDFLKANKAGHATFLPLDTIRPNIIDNERRFVITNTNGFVAFANDLVKIERKYTLVTDYLLGGVIVVDTYENALEMAKVVKYKLNIVTLDGERILPQGAIVGGSRKRRVQISNDFAQIEELNNRIKDYQGEIEENNLKVSEYSSAIDLLREQKSVNNSTIGGIKTSIKNLQISLEKNRDEYRLLTGKSINGIGEEFSIDAELEKIMSDISHLEVERTEIQSELEVANNMKAKIVDQQFSESRKSSELYAKFNALQEEMSAVATDLALINEKRANAGLRLADTYHLTFETALELEFEPIENLEEVAELIKTLRQELNSLGNVNMEAIDEYESEKSRHENLLEQANDIREAIANIKTSISNMDEQMEKQFKGVIKDVNAALPTTFKTLFGGGEAKIVYTDPNDILNSGIEIKIQPPGKKITNLNLLSGGEKSLVALSVLFSILSVRPLPLVILDEVEAPLDIANVERFAKYIRTFTTKTQFMIVTHRMGTMENCDILYGATMEQKGITKIVNVNLIEAKKMTSAN
jgi:chromosome segregation protein